MEQSGYTLHSVISAKSTLKQLGLRHALGEPVLCRPCNQPAPVPSTHVFQSGVMSWLLAGTTRKVRCSSVDITNCSRAFCRSVRMSSASAGSMVDASVALPRGVASQLPSLPAALSKLGCMAGKRRVHQKGELVEGQGRQKGRAPG